VRRFALVLAAFGALVLLGVVIISSAGGRDGDSVALIGDSITDWNDGPLTDALGEPYSLSIAATAGAQVAELMGRATQLAATTPDQVIINLGTNDMTAGRSADDTIADIDAMIRLFPQAECVHVVTINTHMRTLRDRADVERVEELNRAIRALPERFENVGVVAWDEIIDADWNDNPPVGTLTEDTIHPTTPAGRARLVDLYADTLDGCGGWWQL
jgi:lysophospholipase L1-like esterase